MDVGRVRADFPILGQRVHGRPLVYLDNAATTQKPAVVIEALRRYYEADNANIHRGVHALSQRATAAYERARERVRAYINAASEREVIFVRGTTEAINLVAQSHGRSRLGPGDEVVVTAMEHHSNIVPWQLVCQQTGAKLRVAPMTDEGELRLDCLAGMVGERTRIVSAVHVSNSLGTINPVREIVEIAHAAGAVVLLDGAQAVAHLPIDVRELGCDFYAFSGHKLYGPTGIGVLYGREHLLDAMPPYQGGGDMINTVSFEQTTFAALPAKFEAGTPNISGAIGLAAAIEYLEGLDMAAVRRHEEELLDRMGRAIASVDGVRLVGTASRKSGIVSFVMEGVHPHDIGTVLDMEGVAIRTGHHCTQPVMQRLGLPATARASLAIYNTPAEVDALAEGLRRVKEVLL
ncbi:MAG: cysteine desulfurase [Chthonomonadales bacterium]|nr:cysteine desulfurase [Chthonomonadales bacterium]